MRSGAAPARREDDARVAVPRAGAATTLRYSPTVPREVVAVVAPLFRRYVERLPIWVHEVVLKWVSTPEPDDTLQASTAMTASVLPEYRFAVLTVRPGFLSMDDAMRDEVFRHELAHVPVEPLWELCRRLIAQYEEGEVRDLLDEQLRLAGEGCVEDLRMAMDRITAKTLRSR